MELSVIILSCHRTFCPLPMQPQDLMSTFCAAAGQSVNIAYGRGTFCQLSVLSRELPLTYVNFLCGHRTFCQHSSTFRAAGNILSTSVNFKCGRVTFRQFPCYHRTFCELPSTFCQAMQLTVKFRQHFVQPWNFLSSF